MATSTRPLVAAVVEPSGSRWPARLRRPGWLLLPQRLFLGVTFVVAGLQKLADPRFLDPAAPTSMSAQLAVFRRTSPIGDLLAPLAGHGRLLGVLIAVAEVAVGLGALVGLWTRLAAAGGALLSLSFFLTVSWRIRPYYYGSDVVFLVAWLPLVAVGSAGVLSLDAWLQRRAASDATADDAAEGDHDVDGTADADGKPDASGKPDAGGRRIRRRAVLRAAGAGAGLAVVGLAGGGLTAWLGRVLSGRSGGPTAATPGGARPDGAASPTAGAAPSTADLLVDTTSVPVGGALQILDPGTRLPSYVVQPSPGTFVAFNATCTHAGCTVDFAGDGTFRCPCHGGAFDAAGRVLDGPPLPPLVRLPVQRLGGQLRVGPGPTPPRDHNLGTHNDD